LKIKSGTLKCHFVLNPETEIMNNPHKKQELKQHEVNEVLRFLKHYGKPLGAAVLALIVVIIAATGYAHYKTSEMLEAEQLLATAKTPQQLEEVVEKYGSTPAASIALLNLAKITFNKGDYPQARVRYEQFLEKYKSHELRPVAELGLAYCTEADGDFDAAAEQFRSFAAKYSDHYLQPVATLSIARCMEQAGRTDDARILLEDFLAEHGDSLWAGSAQGMLSSLGEASAKN
jgi:predicted negative regulator of RcsB-dependent stress response